MLIILECSPIWNGGPGIHKWDIRSEISWMEVFIFLGYISKQIDDIRVPSRDGYKQKMANGPDESWNLPPFLRLLYIFLGSRL